MWPLRGSTAVVGIERLRNDSPRKGSSTPEMPAIGAAGVHERPRLVDFACISAWSWLSYQVMYTSPLGPIATWQPSPDMSVFWLTNCGALSPGRLPPQVLPPSSERMTTTCWNGTGTLAALKLQQTYTVPVFPSPGRFGPPLTSRALSTAIQF